MAEPMDSLVRILCQDNTAATCQRFIQQQPDVINQLAFFLFFPSVFIILFIYVLSDGILSSINPKFKVLLGVAIYVFIVLSGWYSLFLWISQFWFIFIILIVGIWFFFRKMFGRGGGSGGGGSGRRRDMPGLGRSPTDFVKGKLRNIVTQEEKDMANRIERKLDALEADLRISKSSSTGERERSEASNRFEGGAHALEKELEMYADKGKMAGIDITKQASKYMNKLQSMLNRFKS